MRLPGRANRLKRGMRRKAAATDERKRMTVLKEIEKRGIEDGRDKETRALTERRKFLRKVKTQEIRDSIFNHSRPINRLCKSSMASY
ncbi:hypothetical protein DY000_02046011 [Brassica cretica]|uniref:Uncharacterized protein n=1 Tax=Brassica cretica TaxID=69181 RepID=A0ABQ7F770_BRACR|nr:hypothetical protein DY000_02046011 [Brassica cretica]